MITKKSTIEQVAGLRRKSFPMVGGTKDGPPLTEAYQKHARHLKKLHPFKTRSIEQL